MAWGDVLSDPKIWSSVGSMIPGPIGQGVSFLSSLTNYKNTSEKQSSSEKSYYEALAQQKALTQQIASVAKQRAAFEEAMRSRLLTQTGELGSSLRAAQNAMGPMPQFNEGTLQQDYAATKSGMMTDFSDLVKLTESQGRSDQLERLGGAGSMAADDTRMNAMIKRFTPELQKIDDAAWGQAIQKQTNTMNLYNTSRTNTLNEIESTLTPQIKYETGLMPNGTMNDMNNAATATNNLASEYGTNASLAGKEAGANSADISAQLATIMSQMFNRDNSQINWNGPRRYA